MSPRALLGRLYRRIAGRGPVVLLYHRVASLTSDVWGLAVPPALFDEQMAWLRRHARPMPLRELVTRARAGRGPSRAVAVTFDDGYADNLEQALPVLERHAIPATFFIASGAVGAGTEFWWDALERIVLGTPALPGDLELPIGDAVHRFHPGASPELRTELHGALVPLLRNAALGDRDAAMQYLHEWAGVDAAARASHRTLTAAELRALAASLLVEVGAHTVLHPRLAAQPVTVQQREISGSVESLGRLLDRRFDSFAYPFGSRTDFGQAAVAAVRAAGCTIACTTWPGPVERGSDPLRVRRLYIPAESVPAFAGRLSAVGARR